MNGKTRKLTTLVAVVMVICLSFLEQTSAQSTNYRGRFGRRGNTAPSTAPRSPNGNCKKLKGMSVSVFDPATGIAAGPVTNAGILNGTAEDLINIDAGFVFTPDPSVVSYPSDLTITTIHGQLNE